MEKLIATVMRITANAVLLSAVMMPHVHADIRPPFPLIMSPEVDVDAPIYDSRFASATTPRVAHGSGVYLVTWLDASTLLGSLVAADTLETLDQAGFEIASHVASAPQIASDGRDFLVVWLADAFAVNSYEIIAARVAPDGTMTQPAFPLTQTGTAMSNLQVVANQENYLITYRDRFDDRLRCILLTDDNAPTTTWVSPSMTRAYSTPSPLTPHGAWGVISNGDGFLVVWMTLEGDIVTFNSIQLDRFGTFVSERTSDISFPSSTDPYRFQDITLATSGQNALVAYQGDDTLDTGTRLYWHTMDLDGSLLDTTPNALDTNPSSSQDISSVVSNGDDYLITWTQINTRDDDTVDRHIEGVRVEGETGALLDPSPLVLSDSDSEYPAVAFAEKNYFVVYSAPSGIVGSRVSTETGAVLDNPPVTYGARTGINSQSNVQIVSNGTDYLVLWNDDRREEYSFTSPDLYWARARVTNGTIEMRDIQGTYLTSAQARQIASNGSDYLIISQASWDRNDVTWQTTYHYNAALVRSDGTQVQPTDPFASIDANANAVALGANGEYFIFVSVEDMGGDEAEFYTVKFDPGGTIVEERTPLYALGYDNLYVDIISNGSDFLLLWTTDEEETFGMQLNSAGERISDPFLVSSREFHYPLATYDNRFFTVLTIDSDLEGYKMYGTRIDAVNFNVIDDVPVHLHSALDFRPTGSASNGEESIFIHFDGTRIQGVRMDSATGTPIDWNTMTLPDDSGEPRYLDGECGLASNQDGYLMAYARYDKGVPRVKLRHLAYEGCTINGVDYTENATHPDDPCRQCLPDISVTTWSERTCEQAEVQCTSRICDPEKGCILVSHEVGSPCDDGDPCTQNDSCVYNTDTADFAFITCVSGDRKDCSHLDTPCLEHACHPGTGECQGRIVDLESCVEETDPETDTKIQDSETEHTNKETDTGTFQGQDSSAVQGTASGSEQVQDSSSVPESASATEHDTDTEIALEPVLEMSTEPGSSDTAGSVNAGTQTTVINRDTDASADGARSASPSSDATSKKRSCSCQTLGQARENSMMSLVQLLLFF